MEMEETLLKENLLFIAVSGLLMLVIGLLLYLFKDAVAKNIRFFLPIPPIGVAAYVFVFNLFRHYNGTLPANSGDILGEVIYSTVVAGIVFCAFTVATIVLTYFLKGLL